MNTMLDLANAKLIFTNKKKEAMFAILRMLLIRLIDPLMCLRLLKHWYYEISNELTRATTRGG